MKKLMGTIMILLVTFGFAGSTTATTITYTGSIDTWQEVNQFDISFATAGTLAVDVLAFEIAPGYTLYSDFFGNGTGNDLLDSVVYLFDKNGTGTALAGNDDSWGGSDGSIHYYDSFFEVFIEAGDYMIAIGDSYLSPIDAWNGVNTNSYNPQGWLGNYKLTVTYDPVPEPATMLLLGTGLLGLAGTRRRMKK